MEKVCQQDPELWFSQNVVDKRKAVKLCHACPFQIECAKDGEKQEFGIWGGVDMSNTDTRAVSNRLDKVQRNAEILSLLESEPDITKAEIARRLNMPTSTVKSMIYRLQPAA